MKRGIMALVLLLLLSGCASGNDPYRVDTVIRIPADPTEISQTLPKESVAVTEGTIWVTEEQTGETQEEPAETIASTETEPEKKTTSSSKKSNKKTTSTKKEETKKEESKKETEAKATEPAATKPAETKPAETKPAPTEPVATEAPTTEPPATEAPATEPPVTEPPATEAPVTEPPATEPPVTEPEGHDISGYATGALERKILDLVNEQRRAEGLSELYLDEFLSAVCSCRAWEARQVWSHTRPDGRHYTTVLTDYGCGANVTGELLIYMTGSGDGDYAVRKWMESESHRAQLMAENLSGLGIGIYQADGYTFICCMTES